MTNSNIGPVLFINEWITCPDCGSGRQQWDSKHETPCLLRQVLAELKKISGSHPAESIGSPTQLDQNSTGHPISECPSGDSNSQPLD